MATAVWYPTEAEAEAFDYPESARDQMPLSSRLAPDSPVAGGPWPLVVFLHGLYGGALNCAFLCEHLAAHGYVVAATDYHDTVTPASDEPLATSRLVGSAEPFSRAIEAIGSFVSLVKQEADLFRDYIERIRVRPTLALLEGLIERDDAGLEGAIDSERIALCGHSLGATAILALLAGGWSERFGAAVCMSPSAYPFQDRLERVATPLLVMFGDHDPPITKEVPRHWVYDRVRGPKAEMVLRNATHFSFNNPMHRDLPAMARRNRYVKVINRYTRAFLDRFVRELANKIVPPSPEVASWRGQGRGLVPRPVSE